MQALFVAAVVVAVAAGQIALPTCKTRELCVGESCHPQFPEDFDLVGDTSCREPAGWVRGEATCVPVCWTERDTGLASTPRIRSYESRTECLHWCFNDCHRECLGECCDSSERCMFDVTRFRIRCVPSGHNDFCSGECKMGQGDCDFDWQCAGGLRCGKNNCRAMHPGWDDVYQASDDCCY